MALRRFRDRGWQIDYYTPSGRRVRRVFRTKKEAEAELGKRISLKAEGRYLDVKRDLKVTFDEALDEYVRVYGDHPYYRSAKRFFIAAWREAFGGRLLGQIGPLDLETYRNKRKKTPRARTDRARTEAAVNRELSALRHFLNKCVEWELLERSPFGRAKGLFYKENNRRLRYLTKEEIPALLAECPGHLRPIVVCALNTGMRKEEMLSLKWEQVRDGFIYLARTKTKEGRQVPMNGELAALFKVLRARKQLRSPYVFCDGNGRRFADVRRSFGGAVRRAGIDDFRFHDLRHTFASHFLMRGGSIKTLQSILGHRTIQMTMRYAHLSREFQRDEIQLLNGLTRVA